MVARTRVWPHEGIVPLEVWDVLVEGRSLFARRDVPTFYAALATAVLALRRGEAERAGGTVLPAVPWESVVLLGGGVDEACARAAFAAAGISTTIAGAEPCAIATLARAALGEAAGGWVVVDVGQTAIKIAGPEGATLHRPHGAPLANHAALATAIAGALSASGAAGRAGSLLVGLPCEVASEDGAIVLGDSTLPTAGDGNALGAALGARVRGARDVALVNDAVLAAWAIARQQPSREARLVLTLGFGVGAALIRRATEG